MSEILEEARKEFYRMVDDFGSDPYRLLHHVPEAERWAKYLLGKYPDADKEIVLLSVWLHDLGHYPVPTEIDHAVRSEARARIFLEKEHYAKDKIDQVLHCVRSHRCQDIMPATLEAKIIACIDSASHMTEPMYFYMAMNDKKNDFEFRAYAKMERDYRDLGIFPEIQNKLKGLYESWKRIIKDYEEIEI